MENNELIPLTGDDANLSIKLGKRLQAEVLKFCTEDGVSGIHVLNGLMFALINFIKECVEEEDYHYAMDSIIKMIEFNLTKKDK